jgi:hypothetical protein
LQFVRPVAGDIAIAQVVGEDDQYVGLVRALLGRSGLTRGESQ